MKSNPTNREMNFRYCARCGKPIEFANFEYGHKPVCYPCRSKAIDAVRV